MEKVHDMVIVGGGPGGLTAAIYACRAMLDVVMIEKGFPGGQVMICDVIENFPTHNKISGIDLADKFYQHAIEMGLDVIYGEVLKIEDLGEYKAVHTDNGARFLTKTVIISTGATPRKLGVKGEDEFFGRGVSYCATCDGALFKGKEVAVIGGGDTAVSEAIFLTKFCTKVHIIHRRDEFRAAKSIQKRAFENDKIDVHWNCGVKEVVGKDFVTGLSVTDVKTGTESIIDCAGVFVLVGTTPNTGFLEGFVELSDDGYIKVNEKRETSVSGVYGAGDCVDKFFRQIVTAASDGAIAVFAAEHYINEI